MSAAKHINPRQLQLFMGADELMSHVADSGDRYQHWDGTPESMGSMWERKRAESHSRDPYLHGAGVYKSIKDVGYRGEKLDLYHGGSQHPADDGGKGEYNPDLTYLGDGHHRVAAGAEVERRTGKAVWIPLRHHGDAYRPGNTQNSEDY